jgi:hypothetical protein
MAREVDAQGARRARLNRHRQQRRQPAPHASLLP